MIPEVVQLLEGSVDAAVILDSERRVLFYNRAYEEMAGVRGRELAERVKNGARCYELFELAVCKTACVGCLARDANRPLRIDEISAVRGDGEELVCIVTAVPIGDGFIVESYRDVTAEVRIQRRLKGLLEKERRANVDLQAQLVLQEKMSSLGRLVAGVAHELNNPINFIYGNVDFLRQYMDDLMTMVRTLDEHPALPPPVRAELDALKARIEYDYLVEDSRKLLRSIRNGAERTASIVRDLKTFSRTGSGESQDADVVAGIETTLALIAPLHEGRIEIQRDYQQGLPTLVCNAGHVHQVFMNILTNAAQAIEGTGTIRIAIRTVGDGDESAVQVTVTDSGKGIPPDVLERIVDPFFTTKPVGQGTGLGLWITDSIVRQHGGTMRSDSALGKGATFTVTLPLRPPRRSG